MSLRGAATVARHELLRVVRDPMLVFFGVGLPALLMFLIGSTFYGRGSVDLGVLDLDRSAASSRMVERLEGLDGVEVHHYRQEATLRRDVRTSARTAGLVIPAGFEEDAAAGAAEVGVVIDPTSDGVAAAFATIDGAVAREGVRVAAARMVASAAPEVDDELRAAVDAVADELTPVAVVEQRTGDRPDGVSSFAYVTPANLVLFVFINTFVVSTILANDRKLGITGRILAAPVSAGSVTAGLALAKVGFALVQSASLAAVGTFVFRVRWGDPVAAVSIIVLFAIVAAGVGLIVGAKVQDADQAQSIGVPIGVAAGMLGGCMWPLEIVPDQMRILGHITPHAWAMDAWAELVWDGASAADVFPQIAVLAGAAVVSMAMAARALRRSIVS